MIGRLAGQISTPGRNEGWKGLASTSLLPITAAPPSSHLPQTAGGGAGLSVSCHCPPAAKRGRRRHGRASLSLIARQPASPREPIWLWVLVCGASLVLLGRRMNGEGRSPPAPDRKVAVARSYSCRTARQRERQSQRQGLSQSDSGSDSVVQTPKPSKVVCCSASPRHVSSAPGCWKPSVAHGCLLAAHDAVLGRRQLLAAPGAICWGLPSRRPPGSDGHGRAALLGLPPAAVSATLSTWSSTCP